MEKEVGYVISELAFCQGDNKPHLLASTISARVDVYKLAQPTTDKQEDIEQIKPITSFTKFKDMATALSFRSDGNVLLCGDKQGQIQLFELQNKLALRSYAEHTNQINSLDFSQNKKEFISSSNETNIKFWSILENQSSFTIHGAHSDNVKKVKFIDEHTIISGSSDKTVKLWDLRNHSESLYSLKLSQQVEDFTRLSDNSFIIANGNALSLTDLIKEDQKLKIVSEYYPFQKPIMKVRYDRTKQRVIAGGLDSMIKFFQIENNELKVAYKIKVPSEIFALDCSYDGNHYAMGLNDGTLIIKSKLLEEEEEVDEEQKLLMSLQPEYKSTSKNYKYFFRGQYVMPDPEDLIASIKQRKAKLQPYENALKKFQYKNALNQALKQGNPEVVLALFEELIQRGALELALANRNEEEFMTLLKFLTWKISDMRYQSVLVEVARLIIDMYSAVLGGFSQQVDQLLFKELKDIVDQQITISQNLCEIKGQLDMMTRMASLVNSY